MTDFIESVALLGSLQPVFLRTCENVVRLFVRSSVRPLVFAGGQVASVCDHPLLERGRGCVLRAPVSIERDENRHRLRQRWVYTAQVSHGIYLSAWRYENIAEIFVKLPLC